MYAIACADRGEWSEAMEVAKSHKGLLLGIGIPLVAILRFPWLRAGGFAFAFRFQALIYQGLYIAGVTGLHELLWKKAISIAKVRNKQRKQ